MMTRADAAELASLAIEIGNDLEAHGLVSSKLERLAASLTSHAMAENPTAGRELAANLNERPERTQPNG